jgi:phospholipid/cholesterol/gamma-HCH transport system substrate-binding protein
MPIETRARWAQLRVGLMTMVALAIIGVLIFLMTGSKGLFKSKVMLYTYFSSSSAIADGAPVRLNGIYVGKVSKIALSGQTTPGREVKMDLEVAEEFLPAIPVDSMVEPSTENLLSTKYINITKGKSPNHVKAGDELPSVSSPEIGDLLKRTAPMFDTVQGMLNRLDAILGQVEQGKGNLGLLLKDEKLYNKALAIADDAQKLMKTVNSPNGTFAKIFTDDALYNDVRGTIARLNGIIDGIERGEGTAGKLLKDTALYDDLRKTIADVRQMLGDVNAGKGTVGKLLKSDELHDSIKASMARIDGILDKLNSGQGTLGQMLVNPALYETLDSTMREVHGLMKDFRANPKKFLRIKLAIF